MPYAYGLQGNIGCSNKCYLKGKLNKHVFHNLTQWGRKNWDNANKIKNKSEEPWKRN